MAGRLFLGPAEAAPPLASMPVAAPAAACQPAQAPGPLPQPAQTIVFSDFLGVNAPFLFFDPATYTRQIAALKVLGLKWVRIDLHWYNLEPLEGTFALAPLDELINTVRQAGLEPVLYFVGSAAFASTAPPGAVNVDQWPPRSAAEFASRMLMLAQRYPSVHYWQIWNEQNLPSFWQPREDPAAYAALVASVAQAFSAGAPGRVLILGGMAYYSQMPMLGGLMLEALAQRGIFSVVDAVAYHPYTDRPEGDPADFIERARLLNAGLRAAGAKAVWATEFGWSTYLGPPVQQSLISEATQGDYLLRRLVLMMALNYDRAFWFALSDLDARVADRDRYYGLLRLDASPKPAYDALRNFLAITGDRLRPAAQLVPSTATPGLYSFTWQRDDGARLWLFWADCATTVQLPDINRAVLYQPGAGTSSSLEAASGALAVPAEQYLQILSIPSPSVGGAATEPNLPAPPARAAAASRRWAYGLGALGVVAAVIAFAAWQAKRRAASRGG